MGFGKQNVDDIVSGGGIDLEKGKYSARVFGVMDLGIQTQTYDGKRGKPLQRYRLWVELGGHTCQGEGGKDIPLGVKIDFNLSKGENATLTKLIDAFDLNENDFCVTEMLGEAIRVKIGVPEKSKTGKNAIIGFAPTSKEVPALTRDEFLFTISDPDMKVYNSLFDWEKEELQKAENYDGSKLKKMLGGSSDDDGYVSDDDDEEEEEVVVEKPKKKKKAKKPPVVEEDDEEEEEVKPKKKSNKKKKEPVKEIIVNDDDDDEEDDDEF